MGKKSTSEIKIEGETSLFSERIRRAQKASRSGNWRAFKEIFQEDKKDLLKDLDLFKNTAINVATRSDSPQLLKELLEMLSEQERWVAFTKKSCEGNTLLHEIALICKVVEMADVVLDFEKKMPWPLPEAAAEEEEEEEEKGRPLLERKNSKGETPLFRAAKYGNLKMVIQLAKAAAAQPQSDMKIHLRSDTRTILHASINVQSFDVALWIILRMDGTSLVTERNKNGLTCLQLLARMPTAFRSHYQMTSLSNLIYNLLPDERYEIEGYDSFELFRPSSTDLETGHQHDAKPPTSGLSRINYAAWKYLAKVFLGIDSVWKRKKRHQLAERLAKFLVKNDYSWQASYNHIKKTLVILPSVVYNVAKRKKQVERKEEKRQEREDADDDDQDPDKQEKKHHYDNHTPLLVAASNGIIEIVELFLEEHPESVNHVSEDEQNILHMAVKHRQLEIFKLLKKNPSFDTLVTRISRENRTVLHQVARMDYYRAAHLAGSAFQLQDELKWYKRVEEVVPRHQHLHCDHMRLTAGDVLDIEHDQMLADAQSWIKQTAESCSTVSVLVATVVFAAAYTIPGGSEGGTPVFLRSPVFIFFTVMDVVALAFSLASVVMFLSILTSPFELWDFHKSLPRKLNIGFAFLFCSLTTTMLAFSATILLTIKLQWKHWTSTLVYSAAFFPVTIFGLIEFPLYMMLPSLFFKVYKKTMKVIPIDRAVKRCYCRRVQRATYL
ncbi:uncharacterized protein LOC129287273 [Prosopis cineraria]|uniref:uncharacterized protein LOC129287273 n=1 Tax=Prosopis cineraria TaxID=364024 RepID=UPI0024109863|nr:uncharacterized protein LOC129287273 [Prosopis cineraria]